MKPGLILNILIVLTGITCVVLSVLCWIAGYRDWAIYLMVIAVLMRFCTIAPTLPE